MTKPIDQPPHSQKEIVAAFDFDGTLTYRDTLLPFIRYCIGLGNTLINVASVAPLVICFATGSKTRQQVKETLLTSSFAGKPYSELQAKGARFSQECIHRLLNPEALKKLAWHQEKGHRCILVSATLSTYLHPWTEKMGFQDLICSHLEIDASAKATGKLQGLNCWGQEKVQQLNLLLGPKENYTLYAYGDSRGDRELLEIADYPFYRKFW